MSRFIVAMLVVNQSPERHRLPQRKLLPRDMPRSKTASSRHKHSSRTPPLVKAK